MAQVDSLEISIESSAKKANDAIDSIIKNLENLSKALNIDTRKLSNIGKNIDLSSISKQAKTISESIGNMGAKMSQSMKPMQDNAKNLETILSKINEKYKDLGKGFQFFGNAQSIQKKIDSLSNSLENAKLKKQELESAGKIEGQMYENAVKDVIKYENQIESLKNQLAKTQEVKISVDTTEIEDAENLVERMKEHIRQQMAGIRIENPVNVAALTDEQYAMFKKLQEEMQRVSASAEKMGNQIKEATQETTSGAGFGTALVPIEKIMESATDKTKQFEESLRNLQIPPINTTNINVLERELAKAEAEYEKLRVKLTNGIAMGRISANVDDKGFRTLKEQMYLAEKQGEALRTKIEEIGNTSKTTGGGSNSLSNALKKLSSNANLTSNSIKGLTKNLSRSLSGMKSFTRSILSAVGIMGGLYGAIRGGMSAIDIASQLTEVQNVVDTTFGDMAYKIEDFAQTSIEQFGMSELTLKQVSSRFQAMGTAMGFPIDQMSDMSVELTKLTADMASFYNVEQEDVAKSLESIFTGTTRPLRQYGLDLTQATLQEWALKQGLDANIQSMSQAEKTMLRYQYVMANTGAAQGDFARTMNTWANQVRILKMNFQELAGIIGGVLINAFKPLVQALNAAMSHIIAFAKTISNALGQIFGWTYEEGGGGFAQDFKDAEDASGGIADSTGTAAKNIKKMQAGLRAFDELKVINMPEDTDGSGGGAGGAGGAGLGAGAADGGKWVKKDSILKEYESEIKNLFDLGKYISKSLMDAMNSIDWDSVYEKARGFGKGLADFLNGLFAGQNGQTLFGVVGKTIASALNTAIYAALSFGETFDFKQFGYNIADGINNFFETFDFAALAETINVWVQGIWDVIKTIISETDWEKVWKGAKEFLENLDLETVSIVIGALTIKKILSLHLASTALSWIGTAISQKIAQSIAGKLGFELAKDAGIGAALKTGLSSAFSNISFTSIVETIGGIGLIIGGLVTAVKNFFDMWKDGFSWLKEALMALGIALAAIGAIILGVPAGIAAIVGAAVAAIATVVIVVKDNWEEISGFFVDLWNNIVSVWNKVASWFDENVVQPIVNFFVGFYTRVQQIFEGLWIIVQSIWIVASDWFNDRIITPLVNIFSPIVEKISNFFSKAWAMIRVAWNAASDWFKGTVIEPVKKAFQTVCEAIGGFFTNLWSGIKKGASSAMNVVIAGIEGAINWVIEGINFALTGFNKIVSSAAKITGSSWSGVSLVPKISLGRIGGYEAGGFPEQYSLFMAGEQGKAEILGTVGGKTAVAGGEEITGIKDAIYSSSSIETQLLREQNELLRALLKKEFGITKTQIGEAASDYSREFLDTKGYPAYAF